MVNETEQEYLERCMKTEELCLEAMAAIERAVEVLYPEIEAGKAYDDIVRGAHQNDNNLSAYREILLQLRCEAECCSSINDRTYTVQVYVTGEK